MKAGCFLVAILLSLFSRVGPLTWRCESAGRLGWWGGFTPQLSYLPFLYWKLLHSTATANTVSPLPKSSGSVLCLALCCFLDLGLALGFSSPFLPPFLPSSFHFSYSYHFIMPATPLPPPPPSPPPAASPPTSPQLYQQAVRHQERLQRGRTSPELRRIPSTSATLSSAFAPPPPPSSVTFNGQSYNNLPAHIVAALRNLPSLSATSNRRQSAHVSIIYFLTV